jgi:hypothetical protein
VEVVIDTAAILAVVLEKPEREALVAGPAGARLFSPASLPWEVGNALVAGVRRRRRRLAGPPTKGSPSDWLRWTSAA